MDWLERYKRGRRAALARHGIGVGAPPPAWPYDDDPPPQPEWNGPRESGDPAPIPPDDTGAAAHVAELEAQITGLQGELSAARDVHENDDRLLAELRKMNEQYEAHTAELEALAVEMQAERDQLMDALKIPGLKKLLENTYFPDKHPEAAADEKRALTECAQKINVAYDLIKRDDRAKKSDDDAA
jgi:TolA-binding protein